MQRLHELPTDLILAVIVAIVVIYPLFAVLLMGLFNLAAPLFHNPGMTYPEALGITGMYLIVVGTIVLLKE